VKSSVRQQFNYALYVYSLVSSVRGYVTFIMSLYEITYTYCLGLLLETYVKDEGCIKMAIFNLSYVVSWSTEDIKSIF
jgi:hypothetical protein